MESGMNGSTPALARVFDLAVARAARGDMSGLAADCPGWKPTYSERGKTWIARRTGVWRHAEGDDPRRSYLVIAQDPATLVAVINAQALLDLQVDFPDWDVMHRPGGRWWAIHRDDSPETPIGMCHLSPVRLVAALREHTGAHDLSAVDLVWGVRR